MSELFTGYSEACALQDQRRDSAFLRLPLTLCGVECLQLNARHFAVLIHSRSPFVVGGTPLPENIAQFLWVLHPQFSYTDTAKRDAFIASVGGVDYLEAVKEITAYVDEALMDAPPGGGKQTESYNSFMAYLVDTLAREYGWTAEHILSEPLACVFQYLRIMERRSGSKEPQFNRLADKARNDFLERANAPKEDASHGE